MRQIEFSPPVSTELHEAIYKCHLATLSNQLHSDFGGNIVIADAAQGEVLYA